jgi:hypothetical protein
MAVFQDGKSISNVLPGVAHSSRAKYSYGCTAARKNSSAMRKAATAVTGNGPEVGLFAFGGSKKNNIPSGVPLAVDCLPGRTDGDQRHRPSCIQYARHKALASEDVQSWRIYWIGPPMDSVGFLGGTIDPPMHTDGSPPYTEPLIRPVQKRLMKGARALIPPRTFFMLVPFLIYRLT